MKLIAISLGMPHLHDLAGKPVSTGIYKHPVTGPVHAGVLGLAGDGQADLQNHGGIYKAVYAYPFEHYAHWARVLDRTDFVFGQFGENLTVEGLDEDTVFIGDVLRIGSVLFQVTQPRVPCSKLGARMRLPDFPKAFGESGRTGFYLRVLAEGTVETGAPISRIENDPRRVSVREMMNLVQFGIGDGELQRRALALPALTPGWHERLQMRVHQKEGQSSP